MSVTAARNRRAIEARAEAAIRRPRGSTAAETRELARELNAASAAERRKADEAHADRIRQIKKLTADAEAWGRSDTQRPLGRVAARANAPATSRRATTAEIYLVRNRPAGFGGDR